MFRICDIEVGAEVIGTDITAKVMLEGVDNTEKGNMYYDDFQAEQLNSKQPMREHWGWWPFGIR